MYRLLCVACDVVNHADMSTAITLTIQRLDLYDVQKPLLDLGIRTVSLTNDLLSLPMLT